MSEVDNKCDVKKRVKDVDCRCVRASQVSAYYVNKTPNGIVTVYTNGSYHKLTAIVLITPGTRYGPRGGKLKPWVDLVRVRLVCPGCKAKCKRLYLPPGAVEFRCVKCHRVTRYHRQGYRLPSWGDKQY